MEDLFEQFITTNQDALHLIVALLLGTLIGIQRGWQARDRDPGQRVAGIRTHALTALLGGIGALLSRELSAAIFPAAGGP